MKRARILVADDHSIILAGIRSLLAQDWDLVGYVSDGMSLVSAALALRPDLIILDIGMPVLNGIEAARRIIKTWPEARCLFLTMHTNPVYLREAMRTGACGYVLKTSAAEELNPAIQRVLRGQTYIGDGFDRSVLEDLRTPRGKGSSSSANLTARQREVLQLVAESRTNQQIAKIMNLSVKTIQFHRGQIMKKLGAHSAVKLATFAVKEGIVHE